MVVLNEGMDRVTELLLADVFKCQAGTGTTSPMITDTGLETADATTLAVPTTESGDQAFQVTFLIPSTTGSGNVYSEEEIQIDSGDTSFNRIVHTGLTKGTEDEYTYITTVFLRNGS